MEQEIKSDEIEAKDEVEIKKKALLQALAKKAKMK